MLGIAPMNHSPVIRGIAVSVYLLALAILLLILLIRQGIPRRAALEAVEVSAGIFVVALIVTYLLAERLALNGGDSLLIYLPPVVPVAVFASWLSRRAKRR